MNATNKSDAVAKLVTIWENKNAKRALRGAGLTTMALTLAACGSDSEDLTPFDQDDIDAATTPIQADLDAAIAAAEAAAVTAAAELAAAVAAEQAAAAAAAEAAEAAAAADLAAAVAAEQAAAATAAEAAAATAAADLAAAVAAEQAAAATAAEAAAATAAAELAAAVAAEQALTAAALEDLAALQAVYDSLVAANAALDARTLDADGETFNAGSSADYEIIVQGTTGGDDALAATVTGSGTGTLTFTFLDGGDTVTLAAADLSSYATIVVSAGTVDLSAVTLGAGVAIEINSGVVMTAAQFLAAASITSSAGTGTLEVICASAAEAEAVAAATAKVSGVTAANFDLTNSADSTATDAEVAAFESDADDAITVAAASEDPVGALQSAVAALAVETAAVAAANTALADASDAADLAEAEATLAAASNALVDAQLADADVAAIEAALADEDDAVADVGVVGGAIDTAIADALAAAIVAVDAAATSDVANDSAALTAAKFADARDAAADGISAAETALATTTAALNTAHGLAISRYNSFTAAQEATNDAETAETAANGATGDAIDVAQAIIQIADANGAVAAVDDADGNVENISVDDDSTDANAAVNIFTVTDGVAALDADVVTVNAANSNKYDIAANATVTVTKSYIDDLLSAFQSELDAQAEVASAGESEAAALVRLNSALDLAANTVEAVTLADADLAAYIDDIADLATANETSADLETAISNYETMTALDASITALEEAAADAAADELAGADETDLDAAEAAITAAVNADPAGINFDIDANLDASTNDYVDASGLAGAETVDTTGGMDVIEFGSGFTFTVVADDVAIATAAAGQADVLEILLQQQLDADGEAAGVSVWIEDAAADGSSSNTGAADFTLNNAAGDLSLADLDYSTVEGWIITGTYDTGL